MFLKHWGKGGGKREAKIFLLCRGEGGGVVPVYSRGGQDGGEGALVFSPIDFAPPNPSPKAINNERSLRQQMSNMGRNYNNNSAQAQLNSTLRGDKVSTLTHTYIHTNL